MGDAFRPPPPALFAVVTEPALLRVRERERERVLGRAAKASGKELARACRVINCRLQLRERQDFTSCHDRQLPPRSAVMTVAQSQTNNSPSVTHHCAAGKRIPSMSCCLLRWRQLICRLSRHDCHGLSFGQPKRRHSRSQLVRRRTAKGQHSPSGRLRDKPTV
jgi:hypothetical protein